MGRRKKEEPAPPRTTWPCCPTCGSLDINKPKDGPGKCKYCGDVFTFPGFVNAKGERIGTSPTPVHPDQ